MKKIVALGCLVVTQACGLFESKPFFSHSAATYGCGPAGGATTLIVFSEQPIQSVPPPTPYVVVQLSPRPDTLAGHNFVITGDGHMSAQYFESAGAGVPASRGGMSIESGDSSNAISGLVNLQFSGWTLAAPFHAAWIPSGLLCA
jgi:hypothetical protein